MRPSWRGAVPRVALVLGAIALGGGSSAVRAETVSVCEVLANLDRFNGKNVDVRGVWKCGDAAQFLEPERACEKATDRDGWKWPDRIDLVAEQGNPSVSEYVAYRNRLLLRNRGKARIVATLSGRIATTERFATRRYPGGEEVPYGFSGLVAALRFSKARAMRAVPFSAGELAGGASGDPRPKRVE